MKNKKELETTTADISYNIESNSSDIKELAKFLDLEVKFPDKIIMNEFLPKVTELITKAIETNSLVSQLETAHNKEIRRLEDENLELDNKCDAWEVQCDIYVEKIEELEARIEELEIHTEDDELLKRISDLKATIEKLTESVTNNMVVAKQRGDELDKYKQLYELEIMTDFEIAQTLVANYYDNPTGCGFVITSVTEHRIENVLSLLKKMSNQAWTEAIEELKKVGD